MKRYIALLVVVFVMLGMVGCGGGSKGEEKQITTAPTQTQSSTSSEEADVSLPSTYALGVGRMSYSPRAPNFQFNTAVAIG